jgi:hypothetical protein
VLLLLLLLQGDEDKIVPPVQSEVMWEALKAKGLPTTLMMYKVCACNCRCWATSAAAVPHNQIILSTIRVRVSH